MSAVDKFEIALEHDIDEQYQYEPGETLRGNVILDVNQPIKIKAIQVQVKGEATVSWEEENNKKPITYRADEMYIDFNQNLVFSDEGEESMSLDTGSHKFPLEYTLPLNLPSSFIGKFGSITYVVKATLKEDKKFGLSTLITSEPFLVLRRLDLSRDETLLEPVNITEQKRFFGALAFCVSGHVEVQLNVNKKGHLPGEDIFMDAEITNSSPRVVKGVQAAIVMHSTFSARNKKRYNQQIVNKKRDDWEMSYGEGRRWKGVRLTIPPYIPESRLDGCDIIDIRYELQFKVEISKNSSLTITVPLVVGTNQGPEGIPSRVSRPKSTIVQNGDNPTPMLDPKQQQEDEEGEYAAPEDIMREPPPPEDYDLDDEEQEKFRYPMEPGETRRNPLFASD